MFPDVSAVIDMGAHSLIYETHSSLVPTFLVFLLSLVVPSQFLSWFSISWNIQSSLQCLSLIYLWCMYLFSWLRTQSHLYSHGSCGRLNSWYIFFPFPVFTAFPWPHWRQSLLLCPLILDPAMWLFKANDIYICNDIQQCAYSQSSPQEASWVSCYFLGFCSDDEKSSPGLLLSFSLALDLSHPDLSLNQSHPTEPDRNHRTPEVSRAIPGSSAESWAKSMVTVFLRFLWLFITQHTLTDTPPKLSFPDLTPELQAYTSNSLLNNFIWISNGLLKLIMPEM